MPFELQEELPAARTVSLKPLPSLTKIRSRYDALKWGAEWERYAGELEEKILLLELFLANERADRALNG